MTSILSRLPLELITSIVQYLPTNEVFRLRHVIPEFRSDAVREQALANDQTHRGADSARPCWRPGCENLDEREALYRQHYEGYPCRRVVESRSLNIWKKAGGYNDIWQSCHDTTIASILLSLENDNFVIAVHDLVTSSTTTIELANTTHVALSAKLLVFNDGVEIFVMPREKLKAGRISEFEVRSDPEIWRKQCADQDLTWLIIKHSAAFENYVAFITGKDRRSPGPKRLHIYNGSKYITFHVPNWFTDIVRPQTPHEAIGSMHHLLFDKGVLWHLCCTQEYIHLPNEHWVMKLTFQSFSLDGKLLRQWQHRYKLYSQPSPFAAIVSSHDGRISWLLSIMHHPDINNFIVDLTNCSIARSEDGPYTIWKDKVYRSVEGDNRKIDVLRRSDFSPLGRLSLNIPNMNYCRLIVNDSFMILCYQSMEHETEDVWRRMVFTFDEKLAPDGQRVLTTRLADKRMFWQLFDPDQPYLEPLRRYEIIDDEFEAAMEQIRLLEGDVDDG